MEEIGYRATVFLDNLISNQRDYIEWLLNACMAEGTQISDSLEVAAIDLHA